MNEEKRTDDVIEAAEPAPDQSVGGATQAAFDWFEAAVFALICVAFLFAFVFRTVSVDGSSMVDTLHPKDRLILTHMLYTPQRGDIVVLNRYTDTPLIKRVIAVEGDTLEITADKRVLLNGQEIDEPYLTVETSNKGMVGPIVIEKDHIFVMGDNRTVSLDSRDIGQISVSQVMGKAIFRIWPFERMGGLYDEG